MSQVIGAEERNTLEREGNSRWKGGLRLQVTWDEVGCLDVLGNELVADGAVNAEAVR